MSEALVVAAVRVLGYTEQADAVEELEKAKQPAVQPAGSVPASLRERAQQIEALERKVNQTKKEGREANEKLERLSAAAAR